MPSPRCDTGFRDQVTKIPTLLFLPEHIHFSEDVFRGGESVSLKFICLEEKKIFFFCKIFKIYIKRLENDMGSVY